jgi:hypothetical protein
LLPGAVNVTEADVLLTTLAVPIVGAPGTPHVVTLLLAALAALVPIAFVAVTVNVYAVALVKLLTVIGDKAPVPVTPPGLEVTVYPVIAEPPLSAGALNVTDTARTPEFEAVPIVGAPGTVFCKGKLPPDTC